MARRFLEAWHSIYSITRVRIPAAPSKIAPICHLLLAARPQHPHLKIFKLKMTHSFVLVSAFYSDNCADSPFPRYRSFKVPGIWSAPQPQILKFQMSQCAFYRERQKHKRRDKNHKRIAHFEFQNFEVLLLLSFDGIIIFLYPCNYY